MRYDILQWTRWTDNERSLQQRLAAAEAMLDLSERVGEERHDLNAKLAFASEFARSTKLFRSIVLLCQVGCGQPALALASDLFESSMAAVWASTRSDVADEQAELHARFGRLLLDRTAVQFPYWNRQPEAMSAEDLAAAMSLFGEECSRLWTGHADVAALVDDLTSDFDDWHLAEKWNALANFSYRWAGNMHRPTGQAIESHWESIEPSTLELLTGPAEAFVMDALNFASMTYIWLVQVAVDEFRPDLLPRLKDVEGLGWRAWKNPAELLHRGDDDGNLERAPGEVPRRARFLGREESDRCARARDGGSGSPAVVRGVREQG